MIQSIRYSDSGRIFVQFGAVSYWTKKNLKFPAQIWAEFNEDLPSACIMTVRKRQRLLTHLEALHNSGYSKFELREVSL